MRQFSAVAIRFGTTFSPDLRSMSISGFTVHLSSAEFSDYQMAADKKVEIIFPDPEGDTKVAQFDHPTSLMQITVGDSAPFWELIFEY